MGALSLIKKNCAQLVDLTNSEKTRREPFQTSIQTTLAGRKQHAGGQRPSPTVTDFARTLTKPPVMMWERNSKPCAILSSVLHRQMITLLHKIAKFNCSLSFWLSNATSTYQHDTQSKYIHRCNILQSCGSWKSNSTSDLMMSGTPLRLCFQSLHNQQMMTWLTTSQIGTQWCQHLLPFMHCKAASPKAQKLPNLDAG